MVEGSMNCLALTGPDDGLPLLLTAAALIIAGIVLVVLRPWRRDRRRGRGTTTALVVLPLALAGMLLAGTPAPAHALSSASCQASPGDPGNPGAPGDPGDPGTPTPTATPSSTPTPPPTCTPLAFQNLEFTFPSWQVDGDTTISPTPPPAFTTAFSQLIDHGTNTSADNHTHTENANLTAHYEGVTQTEGFTSKGGAIYTSTSEVANFSASAGVTTPPAIYLKLTLGYRYDDGCGGSAVQVTYGGEFLPKPQT
jgi:hypothetical protein